MSVRNNQERVGAAQAPPPPPPPMLQDGGNESAFSFVAPTEFVELPSQGKYYSEDHPLHNAESVEIRYMTAKDEDILTSQSLIKKGIVIDRFLQNVLVDKNIKVDDLLIGDKNAIIVAARKTGYGSEYETRINCPACLESVQHSFNLDRAKITGPEEYTKHDVELGADNIFQLTAPKSQVSVGLRLMTSRDERTLLTFAINKKKNDLPETTLTDQLRIIIVSVNGSTKQEHVNSFVNNMPAADSRHIRSLYADLMPNIDLTQEFQCSSCGYDEEVVVPFTVEFFWPK